MANSYKDIIITPNRSNTADPKIEFRGGNTTVNTAITIQTYPTSNGTLSFEGTAGQLFSITNDLSGSIFSVNDVSGIPSIEVFANGQINLAEYGGNITVGGNVAFGAADHLVLSSTSGISANGSFGTAGQALVSNGTAAYWSNNPGYAGSRGYTGSAGSTGPQGINGYTGSKGDQGVIGYTGSKGDQGPIGPTGPQGAQGIQGIQGNTGPTGPTGPAPDTSTYVTTTGTQTLTNKTLQTPNITSGLLLSSSAGTSGQVLTSQGAGAAPVWAAASGGMKLISKLTANNSAFLEWTGLSGYSNYMIVVEDLNIAMTQNTRTLVAILGYGSTPTYVTSGYDFGFGQIFSGGANAISGTNFQQGYLGYFNGFITLTRLNGSSILTGFNSGVRVSSEGKLYSTTNKEFCFGGFSLANANAMTAIKIASGTSSNLSSGSVSLYALPN